MLFNSIHFIWVCIICIECHMFMRDPPSRKNKYSSYYMSIRDVDYNIMSPLNTEGYSFPCKGFAKGPSTKVIHGKSVDIILEGTATHEGGHCQFGISYDNINFLVLKTVMSNCLLNSKSYTFNVPDNTPNGDVTIFWTWVNKIGNREYYMDCADITLNTGNKKVNGKLIGKELLVVNLPGYPTIPEFIQTGSYDGHDLFNARKDILIKPTNTNPLPPTTTTISPQLPPPIKCNALNYKCTPTTITTTITITNTKNTKQASKQL